jgi:tetratricopeptide (TPR) repeat protein
MRAELLVRCDDPEGELTRRATAPLLGPGPRRRPWQRWPRARFDGSSQCRQRRGRWSASGRPTTLRDRVLVSGRRWHHFGAGILHGTMATRAPQLLSSIALVLALLAIVLALSNSADAGPPRLAPAAPAEPATSADDLASLDARIAALEQRLMALVTARTAATPPSPAPPDATAADHEQRLAALETAVAALRSDLSSLGPMPDTVAGIVKALADKNLFGHDASPEHKQRRRELWRRFLELAPNDPEAPAILSKAFDDLLATDPRAALTLLDRYRHTVALTALDEERMRASGLRQCGEHDAARTVYARIAADRRLTETDRVDAAFWHAYTWKQQGRYEEARREFAALIAQHGGNPQLESLIGGARGQLEEMERWQKPR